MTGEEQIKLVRQMDDHLLDILEKKRGDYATEDVLSNFKRLSEVSRVLNIDTRTPSGYALFMVLMKIDRINNLLTSGVKPSNESIDDSFGDGINYLKLAYCIHREEVINMREKN